MQFKRLWKWNSNFHANYNNALTAKNIFNQIILISSKLIDTIDTYQIAITLSKDNDAFEI